MSAPLATRARAKVNLTLKVLGRRADGYHELVSLVAFAGVGDGLALEPGPSPFLTISGPFAAGLDAGEGNLVLRAVVALAAETGPLSSGCFHLVKRLPVASGIGGGSADAAAALRLLARRNSIAPDAPELVRAAARLGADVLVCLASQARQMAGIGDRLGPPLTLPPLFAVVANPGLPVATAAVFGALGLEAGQGAFDGAMARRGSPPPFADGNQLLAALHAAGNDLEAPALRIAPVLAGVLAALRDQPGCRLARMSGSGATCFALFDDGRQSAAAAGRLARAQPGWWVKATVLR